MLPPRAIYFLSLNAVRVLSLISLILVFTSTILVMVNNIKAVNAFNAKNGLNTDNSTMVDCDYIEGSTVPNQAAGVFWAVVASLLVIAQTVILFLSECSWPMAFFDKYFPVLGTNFGLGALGIFQALISTQILSHHVDDFTLVSAFFLFALGCINMLLGLIFREKAKAKRSITSWRAEAKGVLPTTMDKRPVFVHSAPVVSHMFTGSTQESKFAPQVTVIRQDTSTSSVPSWSSTEKVGYGFGRQGEKAAGLRGFVLQKPEESLPRYASPSPAPAQPQGLMVPPTVQRSTSSISSSSSFYSQDVSAMPGHLHAQRRRDDDDDDESQPSRSNTPAFKSSRTAL